MIVNCVEDMRKTIPIKVGLEVIKVVLIRVNLAATRVTALLEAIDSFLVRVELFSQTLSIVRMGNGNKEAPAQVKDGLV